MIIYNKVWLSNLFLVEQVEEKHSDNLISDTELNDIKKKYPVNFYSPNIFIRIGLGILTVIISLFGCGFLTLIAADAHVMESYGWFVFLAVLHYIVLELMVRQKHHFRSGIDDVLLWITAALSVFAFIWALASLTGNPGENYHAVSAILFILSTFLSIRFIDRLMSLFAYLSCFALIFFTWESTGSFSLDTMPFVMMSFSAVVYWLLRKNIHNPAIYFYSGSITLLQVLSLISLYVCGNYFVVKELGDMLRGTESVSIPLDWLFWMWTMTIPLLYIIFGIKQKNRILLRTGLLLIAAAVLTFRNYYHLIPVEVALIIAGTITLAFSYLVSQYLRQPRNGFTSWETQKSGDEDWLNAESLIISESFSGSGHPQPEKSNVFGGGNFGGGGSSGSY
ncbi:hypothetical protein [Desertivirga xinjiangensis]|uniref:hypothetical protein n=1 Tax=Desertivirga xinjiangensis TaxID=539206 RepID=UPI00210CCCEC|nr:hypothetical protein [Pedobacter xinjiangensis]